MPSGTTTLLGADQYRLDTTGGSKVSALTWSLNPVGDDGEPTGLAELAVRLS